jgi:hypothetical protein
MPSAAGRAAAAADRRCPKEDIRGSFALMFSAQIQSKKEFSIEHLEQLNAKEIAHRFRELIRRNN